MFSQIDKQILKSWRQYALEPRLARLTGRVLRNTGPRIAVIGNCQSFGVAYSMKLMDPSATVDHFSAIGSSRAHMSLFVKTLATYDYIFTHDFVAGHIRGGDSKDLCAQLSKTFVYPAIGFAAYHPDMILIHDLSLTHGFLFGPIGPYHSAIGLFAYRKGLSLEECNGLFNENVFDALGYFNVWNDAASELINSIKVGCDIDLSTDLLNWSRKGVFMFSTVHPKSFVLYDLARRLWEKVGLTPREVDFSFYGVDDLSRSEVFPVYPPIAKMFGVKGSYLFKQQNHHFAHTVGDFLTLPQYLSSCYKTYAATESAKLYNVRVEAWLTNEDLCNSLLKMAKENLRAGLTHSL